MIGKKLSGLYPNGEAAYKTDKADYLRKMGMVKLSPRQTIRVIRACFAGKTLSAHTAAILNKIMGDRKLLNKIVFTADGSNVYSLVTMCNDLGGVMVCGTAHNNEMEKSANGYEKTAKVIRAERLSDKERLDFWKNNCEAIYFKVWFRELKNVSNSHAYVVDWIFAVADGKKPPCLPSEQVRSYETGYEDVWHKRDERGKVRCGYYARIQDDWDEFGAEEA